MFEKFIEYNGALYGFNTMRVTERDGEFLVIHLNDDLKLEITGSKVTLPMKYNVLKEFLDTGLVYNKQHNVLQFEDLNKPDTYNTDGVYRNELILGAKIIKTSKIEVFFNTQEKRIIDLRKLPFWYLIKDFNTEKRFAFEYDKLIWRVTKGPRTYEITYGVRDIVATPLLTLEQITAQEVEDIMNATIKGEEVQYEELEVKESKAQRKKKEEQTEIDILEAVEIDKCTDDEPKRKTKPRTVSKEKLEQDLNEPKKKRKKKEQ